VASQDPFEDPVVHKQYLKVALSGEGGSGKTRALLSFPKPCVIDTEKGTLPYRGKYDFKVKVLNRWRQLDGVLKWLRANPGVYETLAIDSATIFYLDLIQDIVDYIRNKRGNEIMSPGDWGIEKRRWAAFLNQLVELPMHVVLSFREKAEYEETLNKMGEEVRKKSGNFLAEADKQTEYIFDLGYRCHTELNKKDKTTKFLMTCTKTRFDWSPKYGTWDVTQKRVYQEFFAPHAEKMLDAPDAPIVEPSEPILIVPDPTPVERTAAAIETVASADPETIKAAAESLSSSKEDPNDPAMDGLPDRLPPPSTPEESIAELNAFFGVAKPDPEDPPATLEDIKVLMTKGNEMRWPDDDHKCRKQNCSANGHIHPHFKAADGKSLLRAAYGVESSKELRKPQIEFLHDLFGKVLAGKAYLTRDSGNTVYVANPAGETDEEVKKKVLEYAK
jgi:hypothetical protein